MIELIKRAETYVSQLLLRKLSHTMHFHDLNHTRFVISAIEEIAAQSIISGHDLNILLLAGWFHDTGYCFGYIGHEAISMTIAGDFLRGEGYGDELISSVNECIRSTHMPQEPKTGLQKIMCDADMAHLAHPGYFNCANLLRKEWRDHLNKIFTDREWDIANLEHMRGHTYFTDFAGTYWLPGKQANMAALEARIS